MNARYLAYLQLAAAMMTVGSTVIASRIIGEELDPFLAAALRFAVALPVFLGLMRLTGTDIPKVGWRDGALLVGQAATGSVGYTILLIAGVKRTSAADAGIVIGTLPAAAALVAIVVLGERLSKRTIGAVALATAGVLLVISAPSTISGEQSSMLGDALVLGAVFCECLFILLNKRLSQPWPPLALSTAMSGLGLLIAGAFSITAISQLQAIPMSAGLAVLYYALVPTVIGFWLWYSGAARVSGGEAAIFTAIAPITGVILAWLLLGDALTLFRLLGLIAVIAAVLITAMPAAPNWRKCDG